MAQNSKITWTHHTFNPWIGCAHVSEGCRFCYAEAYAERYWPGNWGINAERHKTAPGNWAKPLHWNRMAQKNNTTYRVFCASLADVMEDNLRVALWREELWQLIKQTPHLNWLLLTKRPENFVKFLPAEWLHNGLPHNLWLMASICNQREYDEIMPVMFIMKNEFGAAITGISFEPLLGPINLHAGAADWNIIGGESGPLKNARPMHLEWVKRMMNDIRNEARPVRPALVFFKQLGSQIARKLKLSDTKGEDWNQWPDYLDWLKIRQIPFENNSISPLSFGEGRGVRNQPAKITDDLFAVNPLKTNP